MLSKAVYAGVGLAVAAGLGVGTFLLLSKPAPAPSVLASLCVIPPGTPNCQPEDCVPPSGAPCLPNFTFAVGDMVQATALPLPGEVPTSIEGYFLQSNGSYQPTGTVFPWAAGQIYFTIDFGAFTASQAGDSATFYALITNADGTTTRTNTVTINIA